MFPWGRSWGNQYCTWLRKAWTPHRDVSTSVLCFQTSVPDSTPGIHERHFISVEFWLPDGREQCSLLVKVLWCVEPGSALLWEPWLGYIPWPSSSESAGNIDQQMSRPLSNSPVGYKKFHIKFMVPSERILSDKCLSSGSSSGNCLPQANDYRLCWYDSFPHELKFSQSCNQDTQWTGRKVFTWIRLLPWCLGLPLFFRCENHRHSILKPTECLMFLPHWQETMFCFPFYVFPLVNTKYSRGIN